MNSQTEQNPQTLNTNQQFEDALSQIGATYSKLNGIYVIYDVGSTKSFFVINGVKGMLTIPRDSDGVMFHDVLIIKSPSSFTIYNAKDINDQQKPSEQSDKTTPATDQTKSDNPQPSTADQQKSDKSKPVANQQKSFRYYNGRRYYGNRRYYKEKGSRKA